jgi:HD superfamily phosphohydrolase
MKIKQLQEQIASREHVYRAVYQNKVVSINSFTLSEIASYSEHEWLFSDGSCLPSNDVEE